MSHFFANRYWPAAGFGERPVRYGILNLIRIADINELIADPVNPGGEYGDIIGVEFIPPRNIGVN